ncbi:unnamed protein product [Heligmosomoides polygyrus]|uniref:G protein-coupled receptor n=1 Tax=Heligmosomoides polygyrus TaxID=6339 RepID=A0A3P7YJC2_HELPZ|nr:unnamed protein product [Heligmosomoides polygyrus]
MRARAVAWDAAKGSLASESVAQEGAQLLQRNLPRTYLQGAIWTTFQVTFSFASDSVDDVRRVISVKFDYDMVYGSVSGILNIMSWKPLFTVLHMSVPIIPAYIAILILRRATILKLNSLRNMSEHCRLIHTQLLNALTYHACLPIFYLIAVVGYLVGQLDIYHHPILEFSIVTAAIIPMFSPLTSFRFVRPYREWICDRLLRRH